LVYQGEFDDVDIAMMIHADKNSPAPLVNLPDSSNGFVGMTIQYVGKEAHAAGA
jgi:metal-dependent amidase/aminoacylase/carboxypeptidase family protein